jgi:hypothetical protein
MRNRAKQKLSKSYPIFLCYQTHSIVTIHTGIQK